MSGPWTLAVDFGTTSTVTAMCGDDGAPEILEVDGNRKMPSMVVVDNDHTIVVGIAAAGLARSMPQRTIRTPKNRLGDAVPIVVGGTPFQPVAFVTSVLEHVLADATRFQGRPPTHSRLTYPATWNRPKRARLLEAAAKAGYPEPELVAEPIAAALTYADATTLGIGDHVAVFDLGGGTFDTVVLLRTETGFSVVGRPVGDPQLGGELFDEILMNYVGEQIDQATWDQLLVSEETDWMRAAARLRAECKRAKEALSSHPVADVSVGLPTGSVDVSITRHQLDELIVPFIDESIELLDRCMTDAGENGETITAIYVTGGASRMPVVEQRVRDAYPNTLVSRRGDPKVAVALGALLAVPGSLDDSIQQSPARTTVEEPDESTNTPTPQAPSIATPPGPATRVHEDSPPSSPAAVPPPVLDVPGSPATPPPALAVPIEDPSSTILESAPMHAGRVLNDAVSPQAAETDGGISLTIVFASLVAALVLVGGIGAALLTSRDGNGSGEEQTSETIVESTTNTSTDEPPVEDTTPEDTPTKVSDSTTSTDDGIITEAAFRAASLTESDLGFGFVVHPGGVDTVNRNLCGIQPPVPLLRDIATFGTTEGLPPQQVTNEIQLFVDADGAAGHLDFAKSLASQCPNPEIQFTQDEVLTTKVVPLQVAGADGEVRQAEIPDIVDDHSIVVYEQSREAQPSYDAHLISVDVRVGRATGTIVQSTPGTPNQGHLDFLNAMLVTLSTKLLELQQ